MRAVLFGLVGAVLLGGAAQAGECKAGNMAFVSGDQTFKVSDTSLTQAKFASRWAERTIMRGDLSGQPVILDIQGAEGSSTNFTSYAGATAKKTAMLPNWGVQPTAWSDGADLAVYDGPLKGEWRAVCR